MEISPGGRIQPTDRLPLVDRITSRRNSPAKMANNGGRRSAVDRRPIAAIDGRRRRPRSTDGQDGGRGPGRRGRMNKRPLTLTLAGGSSNVNSMYRSQRLFGSLDLIYKIKQKRRLDPPPPPPPASQERIFSNQLGWHPTLWSSITFMNVSTAPFATSSTVVPVYVLWFIEALVSTKNTMIVIVQIRLLRRTPPLSFVSLPVLSLSRRGFPTQVLRIRRPPLRLYTLSMYSCACVRACV